MPNQVATHPFPGYRPFNEADEGEFFGREPEADALEVRLATARVLAVVGPAEHGKSSLVRAGVIPRVRKRGGRVAVLRPGEDPVGNLARALSEPEALGLPSDTLEPLLRSGPGGLAECVRAAHLSSDQDLLVVVDQLDELFRYRRCREHLKTATNDALFVALLIDAGREQSGVRILVTMRAETVWECRAYPALHDVVQRKSFEVPAMSKEQLRRAIEKPIAKAGGRVAREFVETVVQAFDPKRVPSALPLVQHALMRAWDLVKDADEELSVHHLETAGGVSHALFAHADAVCKDYPKPKLVGDVVRCITTYVDGHFVARPASIRDIAKMCEAGVEDVTGVVERLQAPGVTFLKPPATGTLDEDAVVDISYDSFAWVRRHRWSYQTLTALGESSDRNVRRAAGWGGIAAAALAVGLFVQRTLWPALLALTALLILALFFPTSPGNDGTNVTFVELFDGVRGVCKNGGVEYKVGSSPVTHYLCSGTPGESGPPGAGVTLVGSFSGERGLCKNGGVEYRVGTSPETQYVCDGAPGGSGPPGTSVTLVGRQFSGREGGCQNGGVAYTVGNSPATQYVCNGTPGKGGDDGPSVTLVGRRFSGSEGGCQNGGVAYEVRNSSRSQGFETQYVCDGAPGGRGDIGTSVTFVRRFSEKDKVGGCQNGGVEYKVGSSSVSQYVCNGPNGRDASSITAECAARQVLVGVVDGKAICRSVPFAPSIQFDRLPTAVAGFRYHLDRGPKEKGVEKGIEELDLHVTILDNQVRVSDFRRQVELLPSKSLDEVQAREVRFPSKVPPGGYGYALRLSPEAGGGWSAVIRRCSGVCPERQPQ